ncbi:PilN domain-containing protein [Thiolapillus sp.]|uniref:PilN domain-containing protein n=5 Tax=Thiolapillus sp. TaxID=2017437 RepID=UPI00263A6FC0|nr:PilN domain-containing protein [Thiolapillus sp.]
MLLRTWLPYDWTPRSEAYFVFPLAQGTPGKQCGLAATGDYQPSLRSPWLAAKDIEKKRADLIARMNVIQDLQASRPMVVHLFDELVKTIPDGVFLQKLSQKGVAVTLKGQAQSNARVSNYMRGIDRSEWMTDAQLKVIKSQDKTKTGMSEFELTAKQANPNAPAKDEK